MNILSLHPNQLRILLALQSAVRVLQMPEQLTIVGSLGRVLAGQAEHVGDIDVKIDTTLCGRYWEFIEVLGSHGVKSVFDVFDRPQFPWDPCCSLAAHALALTVDCSANTRGMKHANLDISLSASDISAIPHSSRWVHLLNPDELRGLDDTARAQKIHDGHRRLITGLMNSEKYLPNRRLHDELGLYFSW